MIVSRSGWLPAILVVAAGLLGCGSENGDAGKTQPEAESSRATAGSDHVAGHWETVTGLEQGMVFSFNEDGTGSMQMGSFHDEFRYSYEPGQPSTLTMSNPAGTASQEMECYLGGDTLTVIRRGDTSVMVRRAAPPASATPHVQIDQMILGKWTVEVEGTKLEHTFRDDGTFVAINLSTGQRMPGSWTLAEEDFVVMMLQGRPMKGRVSFDGDDTMILDTPNSKLVFERIE